MIIFFPPMPRAVAQLYLYIYPKNFIYVRRQFSGHKSETQAQRSHRWLRACVNQVKCSSHDRDLAFHSNHDNQFASLLRLIFVIYV